MQKSTGNGLMVNVYVEDFQYSKLTINDTVKKSVKDGVEQIDSIYSASAEVFQPLRLKVVAPNGESYSNQITTSRKPKKISTQNFYTRSEEHTSELQSRPHLVCRLLLEKKKKQ